MYNLQNLDEVKKRLIQKNVEVSEMRPGEPKRFDMTDLNGNKISVIEL